MASTYVVFSLSDIRSLYLQQFLEARVTTMSDVLGRRMWFSLERLSNSSLELVHRSFDELQRMLNGIP
jgi:hypothetical protein